MKERFNIIILLLILIVIYLVYDKIQTEQKIAQIQNILDAKQKADEIQSARNKPFPLAGMDGLQQ